MTQRVRPELLERDSELEVIASLAAGAAAGNGALALVEGPAGVGKSSLLWEALAIADGLGFETASARAAELERDFPFGLVRQLFEPRLAAADARQRAELLSGAAGLAAPLFDPLEVVVGGRREEAFHATLHGLYWLTVNLASHAPLALATDDLHWADAPSLRFLAYLANRVDELPVLMVGAARPTEPGAELDLLDELATGPSTRAIRPQPLGAESVARLVHAALGEPAPAFAAACHDATRGNPLLLHELLATLAEESIPPTAEQAGSVLDVASRSIARSVSLRLRRLGRNARALARALAVLGDGARIETAARLAGLERDAAATASSALAEAELLRPTELEFAHPVVRTAIYSQLPAAERSRWHRTAATILADAGADDDEVALHLMATRPAADAWGVDVLRRAALRAHSRGAPDIAATYLQRALAEPPADAQRADLLVDLGLAELAVNRMSGFDRMREALDLPEDPRARARLALQLARSLFLWVDFAGAARVLEDALADLPANEAELRETVEALLISASFAVPERRERVLERISGLLQDSSGVSDPVLLATLSAAALAVEPAQTGVALATRALADVRLSLEDHPTVVAMAAVTLMSGDRLADAQRVWDRAIAEASAHGAQYMAGFAMTMRAFARVRIGAIAGAEADAGAALERRPEGIRDQVRWILCPLVDALVERGALDDASELLLRHEQIWQLPDSAEAAFLLDSVARLRLAQGQTDEAIEHLRDCGRRVERWGVRNPGFVPWRASLAVALAAAGRRDEAAEVARKEIELARAFEVPRELGMALRAAGLAQGGAAGVEQLREAVDVLAESPAQLEHARALTDLGAALRRAGSRSDAREPLRAGLDLAQRCDATALVRRAHDELVASGARPRRFLLTGVDSLTASERRVAEMASEGLTNREIAQALFVTEKTVEGHLGHAYRKLDVKSRSELPRALIRRPSE